MDDLEIADSYSSEWATATKRLDSEVSALMEALGITETCTRYINSVRGFPKYIYPLAAWVPNAEIRLKLGVAFSLHCFGVKLLDDIVDDDTFCSPRDLVIGSEFCNRAYVILTEIDATSAFFSLYTRYWSEITPHLRSERLRPIRTVEEWKTGATLKCGRILRFYAHVGAVYSGKHRRFLSVGNAIESMGVVYTLLDDIRDQNNPAEQDSNIVALINKGLISLDDVRNLLEASAETASQIVSEDRFFPIEARYFSDIEKVRNALHSSPIRV